MAVRLSNQARSYRISNQKARNEVWLVTKTRHWMLMNTLPMMEEQMRGQNEVGCLQFRQWANINNHQLRYLDSIHTIEFWRAKQKAMVARRRSCSRQPSIWAISTPIRHKNSIGRRQCQLLINLIGKFHTWNMRRDKKRIRFSRIHIYLQ